MEETILIAQPVRHARSSRSWTRVAHCMSGLNITHSNIGPCRFRADRERKRRRRLCRRSSRRGRDVDNSSVCRSRQSMAALPGMFCGSVPHGLDRGDQLRTKQSERRFEGRGISGAGRRNWDQRIETGDPRQRALCSCTLRSGGADRCGASPGCAATGAGSRSTGSVPRRRSCGLTVHTMNRIEHTAPARRHSVSSSPMRSPCAGSSHCTDLVVDLPLNGRLGHPPC